MIRKILILLFLAIICSCKKDREQKKDEETKQPNTVSGTIVKANVHVIDSLKLTLKSDSNMLAKGDYQYSGEVNGLNYQTGDILIGQTQAGYIRKIKSITKGNNVITFSTEQASMTDVFKYADVKFDLMPAVLSGAQSGKLSSAERGSSSGATTVEQALDSEVTLAKGGFSATASIAFDPKLTCKFQIDSSTHLPKYVYLGTTGATLTGKISIKINGTQGVKVSPERTIVFPSKRGYFMAGEIPVIYDYTPKIVITGTLQVKHTFNKEINYLNIYSQAFAVKYENGAFSLENPPLAHTKTLTISDNEDQASGMAGISVKPQVDVRFYGVATASIGFGINASVTGTVALPSKSWDITAKAWLDATLGAKLGIFGLTLAEGSRTFSTDPIEYTSPKLVKMISGDGQTAGINQDLAQPIKVQVFGPDGKTQNLVRVLFKAENDNAHLLKDKSGHFLDSIEVFTDKDGYAQTKWTLYGENLELQKVTATVKTGALKDIGGSPVSFSAVPTAKVGDQAFGGTIFYIDATNKHGFVASKADQGRNLKFDSRAWSDAHAHDVNFSIVLPETIGSGWSNTNTIIANDQPMKNITLLCTQFKDGKYTDWFLPSKLELLELYKVKDKVGGFSNHPYLSSSAYENNNIIYTVSFINFADGKDFTSEDGVGHYSFRWDGDIRAIRAF